jgi:hypothetical protein
MRYDRRAPFPRRHQAGRIVASTPAGGTRAEVGGRRAILRFEVNVITKELLKAEIDKVPEENLGVLYKIVKALENPGEETSARYQAEDAASWKAWVAETYGSTADAPIERGEPGFSPTGA